MKQFRWAALTATLLLAAPALYAATYTISAPAVAKKIVEGGLKLGGTSPSGGSIAFNSYYMSIDGQPAIPVMGEMHYARYPRDRWEEEILKMKAGGLTVIPTYVFWNLHEQREGQFDWSGQLDLRAFVELCGRHGMPVIVRIGPFCHGEMRNGGLPDWLFARPLEVRSNDSLYLHYVDRLYGQIAAQLRGLYYKDGGPVIGIQIENEHQHSAAPWAIAYQGEAVDRTTAVYDASTTLAGVGVQTGQLSYQEMGELHMKTLKDIAVKHGMEVPVYTATGWGMAAVIGNEAVPVTAAYTYPTWVDNGTMSDFCLFKDIQRNPDYSPVRYDGEQFPSFAAEMGVGIQMTYPRRPVVLADAAEALVVRTLGSGSNGIGYYMFHGGSTPKQIGGVGFMSEEPGCPKISYDFQAPLGEFGLENGSYRRLRLLHAFVNDFGHLLAPMETVLPEGNAQIKPSDRETLRYAIRVKDGQGFIFMVNFQDHDLDRHDQTGLQLRLNLGGEELAIPFSGTFTLPKDVSAILPFNFQMQDARLKYATAQLMMKLDDNGIEHYIFFAHDGMSPEYMFDEATVRGRSFYAPAAGLKSTFTVRTKAGKQIRITTLTREQALQATRVDGRLLITSATVVPQADGSVDLLSLDNPRFSYVLYPSKAGWNVQTVSVQGVDPQVTTKTISSRRLTVHFDTPRPPQVHEFFLRMDYTADVAMAFLNGEMVLDHFYHGVPWTIGLNRFAVQMQQEDMVFYFRPITAQVPYLADLPAKAVPDFSAGDICRINQIRVIPQYIKNIQLK